MTLETPKKKKSLQKIIRSLHRDIGFFLIGMTLIYCISGLFLIYRGTGILKKEKTIHIRLAPNEKVNTLAKAMGRKELAITEETDDELRFNHGVYHKKTGELVFTRSVLPSAIKSFISLHRASNKKPMLHWFTATYGVLLMFLALSSFWMYKPGNKLFTRGIILATLGVLASIGLLFI